MIDSDEYYLQCGRYIDLNPIRAKLVEHPSEWRWSSYGALANGAKEQLVDFHPLYVALGNDKNIRQKNYARFVKMEIDASRLNNAMRFSEKYFYGKDEFIEQIKEKYFVVIPRPKAGRPRN